jgi:hypothetical protein
MGIKYHANENFFEQWTPTMAYVLGYLYADGSLEDASYIRGKYIRLTSIDKELINFTKKALNSKHHIVIRPPDSPNRKIRYFLRIGSHKLYNDLLNLGLYPNKSLTIKFPKIDAKFLPHFIRGYFDGDGHVGIAKNKKIFKRVIVVFVSGSLDFLTGLANEMNNILELRINKVYKDNKSYRLAYSTADSVKIFKYLYKNAEGEFLSRKFGVFKKFFINYNKWADSEVLQILNK